MKKTYIATIMAAALLVVPQTLLAAGVDKNPLKQVQFAVKADYINFTDSVLDRAGVDRSIYLGIEGYYKIGLNCYVGMEIGWAEPDGEVTSGGIGYDTSVTYIPLELNTKYAIAATPNFVFDVGVGLSYNYIDEEISRGGARITDDDWLLGGQIFLDANYVIDNYFLGLNAKYQITDEVDNSDYSYDNWRLGAHVGIHF